MKDLPIEKFGTKLMVSSKSVNKIPDEYLKYAQNARIYDWGIWPAKGKQLLTSSALWTNNKGGFTMNGKLYQITNSIIYEINESDWTQTSIATLWYDSPTDNLVYSNTTWSFSSLATDNFTFSVSGDPIRTIKYVEADKQLKLYDIFGTLREVKNLSVDNTWKALPAVRLVKSWTATVTYTTWFDDWSWYILTDWQYVNILANSWNIEAEIWYYNTIEIAIIVSADRDLEVFDWTSTLTPVAISNSWIIEYTRGYSFLADNNVLRISRPITVANPEYAYDFTWAWSQQITYKSKITSLIGTMNWLYVFTEDTLEFLGANSLQNVAWSATFISTPLWEGWKPVNNHSVAASWDRIFYITENQQIKTVNYIAGTSDPSIWELSSRPIIWIKELLDNVAIIQPTSFAFENENDNTIQFHLRTTNALYNDIVIVYDLVNDTWDIDKGKNYNYVVKKENLYYWYSDINSSIYLDDTWFSMAWSPIPFRIITQAMNQWSIIQKKYGWFFTAWAIWPFSTVDYIVRIDWGWAFQDKITWDPSIIHWLWELWGATVWWEPTWWDLVYETELQPFDRYADEGRICLYWKRIEIEIRSSSQIQDFLIDILWIRAEQSVNIDISDKF